MAATILGNRQRETLGRIGTWVVLGIALILVLFPIYWMTVTSLKLPRDIYRTPSLWPRAFTGENYRILLQDKGFLLNIGNSLLVALTVTVIAVIISSFAAYSMVRFRYRFRGLFGLSLAPLQDMSKHLSWAPFVGLALVRPYLVAFRFLLYIDCRTRREGWDLQVQFSALAARSAARTSISREAA